MKQISSPWNVVILFNEELTEELINLSHFIASKIPSKVELNRTDALPHLTIYTTNYPTKNLMKIKKKLSLVVKKFNQFTLQFSTKIVDMNTVFINAELNKTLQNLHSDVVDALNPLRDGLFDEKELALIGNNEARKKSLLMYGMWSAKKLYVPHISVARPFDQASCKQALNLLPKKIHYMTPIKHITLAERGHDGTCKKIIKIYSLKE